MGRSRHCSAADRFRQPEFVSPLVVHMSRFASVVSPFAIILSSSYGSLIWSSASKKVGILCQANCQVFSSRRVYTLPMEIIKSIVTGLPRVGVWALEFAVVGMNGIDKGVRLRGWDWSGTWVYLWRWHSWRQFHPLLLLSASVCWRAVWRRQIGVFRIDQIHNLSLPSPWPLKVTVYDGCGKWYDT